MSLESTNGDGLLDRALVALGPFPNGFNDEEKRHAKILLGVLIRSRAIDEIVWNIVTRYARHRARWDQLQAEIRSVQDDESQRSADRYMSGKEQMLSYHENALHKLERELVNTPYARVRAGQSAQTDFLDQLGAPPTNGGPRQVVPFTPLSKQRRG